MKLLNQRIRFIWCGLILVAFFLPAYNGVSGFEFISFAFSEARGSSEITNTDVVILILPLLAVPLSALGLLFSSLQRMRVRVMYMALPLLCLFVFLSILFISARNGSSRFSDPGVLMEMEIGFYLALVASAVLPFTKNPRKRPVRKDQQAAAVEVAA